MWIVWTYIAGSTVVLTFLLFAVFGDSEGRGEHCRLAWVIVLWPAVLVWAYAAAHYSQTQAQLKPLMDWLTDDEG